MHDLEIETALLGSLMADDAAWDAVSDLVKPQLFESSAHREIAAAVFELRTQRRPADPVSVRALLARKPSGALLPGEAVDMVANAPGAPSSAREYASQLRDRWACRELKRIAREALEDEAGTAADRLSRVQQHLSGIEVGKPTNARHLSLLVVDLLEELKQQHDRARSGAQDSLFPTGFSGLDALIAGFRPGMLSVFAARPSVGKSSWAVALADNLAARKIPVGIFWLEDDWRDLTRRVIARRAKVKAAGLRHGSFLTTQVLNQIEQSAEQLITAPIYVDDTHGVTASEIAFRMRRMTREHGVRVFIADHLGEIGIEREDRWGDRHDLALGRAARLFRDTAKDLDAAPILLVQMNRQVERRADPTPKLADLDGSGQIEQAARLIGFLSKPADVPNSFVIDVLKNTSGPQGQVHARWMEDYMTMVDQ